MYKVFFVDDEAAMRTGLRDSINWERSDFTLVGEAPDGELALSLISETLPDILITDVKMPFMDGLELSRRVTRTMPWVKIIILSGHDEFEYAQQAIRIGVSEYLLKPVTSETLFRTLESAAREIEAERERRHTIEGLRKEVSDARRFQTERTLSNLVYGLSAEIPPGAGNLGSFTASARFLTTLMEISPAVPDDLETIAAAGESLFELLSSNENIRLFPEGAERVICLFAAAADDLLEEEAYATAQAVKYEIERRHACAVSIAIGSTVKRVLDLPKSFSHAKRAMCQMERLGRRMIAGFKDIADNPRAPREEEGRSQAHGAKSSRYCDVIEKSTEYIREHFAEGNVSLNTVAEFVGLSPNHFSTVFSQETGETFIECLTRVRLRNAEELLKTTSIRSWEIAYRVGYNDPHYFSYVFKKNIGLSPSEYRNKR
ncbi:MAG: response regulator [Synergistaceae bacterium]|jgi:two-component system response regulator YesN|nr:response regulator [Synergistaceae bacterium]